MSAKSNENDGREEDALVSSLQEGRKEKEETNGWCSEDVQNEGELVVVVLNDRGRAEVSSRELEVEDERTQTKRRRRKTHSSREDRLSVDHLGEDASHRPDIDSSSVLLEGCSSKGKKKRTESKSSALLDPFPLFIALKLDEDESFTHSA